MGDPESEKENWIRYKNQLERLELVLDRLEARYKPDDMKKLLGGRQDTIVQLLRGLKAFGKSQFYFFYNGFNKIPGDSPALDRSMDWTPEHVLANTVYQFAEDLATIQLAAEQRIRYAERLAQGDKASNRKIQVSLGNQRRVGGTDVDGWTSGDELAGKALWQDGGVMTVLSYLTHSVTVRVVPYAPVALVGIPYSSLSDVQGLMAIAHELGHFRFWHSWEQTRENLETRGAGWGDLNTKWLNLRELFYPFETSAPEYPWSEEIFADVYGTLVGGPLYILTAMDMAMEHSSGRIQSFAPGDKHPAPMIRPVLMIKALKALNETIVKDGTRLLPVDQVQVLEVMTQLFNRWQEMLPERDINPVQVDLKNTASWNAHILRDDKVGEKMVLTAVEALRYAFHDIPAPRWDWGWPDTAVPERIDLDTLYKKADVIVAAEIDKREEVAELESVEYGTDTPSELWKAWVNQKGYFETWPPTGPIASGDMNSMDPKKRSSGHWLPVFGAGGWTTEGPCSMPPG